MVNFNWQTNTLGKGREIHLPGANGNDATLCGLDISGDPDIHLQEPYETTLPATCPNCIEIVEFCKSLSKKRYTH